VQKLKLRNTNLVRTNKYLKMINYIKESYSELKNHVTWTTWSEAQRLTVIVAAFSVVLALLVFGIDTVFSGVISRYFEWIKS
jgi:preprotein translocase subunit SecE